MEFDSVLAEIQQRVQARRASGEYPLGLEEQLEAEFDQVLRAVQREEVDTSELRRRLADAAERVAAVTADPDVGSRVPGGSVVHTTAARVVRRHTTPLAESVRAMGRSIEDALTEVVRVLDAQRDTDERQLNEVIGSVFDRLAVVDHLVEAVAELERRMDQLERTSPGR